MGKTPGGSSFLGVPQGEGGGGGSPRGIGVDQVKGWGVQVTTNYIHVVRLSVAAFLRRTAFSLPGVRPRIESILSLPCWIWAPLPDPGSMLAPVVESSTTESIALANTRYAHNGKHYVLKGGG